MPGAGRAGLLRAAREQAGLDVVSLVPAGGESGTAFWARERGGGSWMVKIAAGPAAGALAQLRALDTVTAPAP